jgi:hypothetical protein
MRQKGSDRTVGTGQFGQTNLTLRLDKTERKGWPEIIARTGQLGQCSWDSATGTRKP